MANYLNESKLVAISIQIGPFKLVIGYSILYTKINKVIKAKLLKLTTVVGEKRLNKMNEHIQQYNYLLTCIYYAFP